MFDILTTLHNWKVIYIRVLEAEEEEVEPLKWKKVLFSLSFSLPHIPHQSKYAERRFIVVTTLLSLKHLQLSFPYT